MSCMGMSLRLYQGAARGLIVWVLLPKGLACQSQDVDNCVVGKPLAFPLRPLLTMQS